jgi:hypothetical protein
MRKYVTGSAVALLVLSIVACDPASNAPTASAKPEAKSKATASAAAKALTSEELAWLDALTKLRGKIEKNYVGRRSEILTPARMRSYAKLLRGCRRELTRLGAPSQRLRPVYVITQEACVQADKGARCLDDAAKIGIPVVGTASERRSTRAINCGLNALGDSSNLLADASRKGQEIKASAG